MICTAITILIPRDSGNNRDIHAGGYQRDDRGLAANGYPLRISGDHNGTPSPAAIDR